MIVGASAKNNGNTSLGGLFVHGAGPISLPPCVFASVRLQFCHTLSTSMYVVHDGAPDLNCFVSTFETHFVCVCEINLLVEILVLNEVPSIISVLYSVLNTVDWTYKYKYNSSTG